MKLLNEMPRSEELAWIDGLISFPNKGLLQFVTLIVP